MIGSTASEGFSQAFVVASLLVVRVHEEKSAEPTSKPNALGLRSISKLVVPRSMTIIHMS